jgi:hypothetical protein
MRKIEYLIKEARQNTNTTDVEAITNQLCVSLLNRAQEFIQAFIFTQNVESRLFRGQYSFNTSRGIDSYDLPFDIYAKNSVDNIMYKNGNTYSPMRQISEKARGTTSGYFLSDSTIILSPIPSFDFEISVSYTKSLPNIGISYGTIQSIVTNTSITLATGYSSLTGIDDFFCIVDINGLIIKRGLVVNQTAGVLSLSDTSLITAGMFVVPGKYSTIISQLPDEFESALIMSLETMIDARLSSKDTTVAKSFGDEMLSQIGSMFADNNSDTFMPPIVEYSEWV